MKTRISLLCCAFLLALVPALWATPPAPGDCAPKFELASMAAAQPLAQLDLEKLSPVTDAQPAQTANCCTQQDWQECVANLQQGCWIEQFYCYQGWFCYCGYNCW